MHGHFCNHFIHLLLNVQRKLRRIVCVNGRKFTNLRRYWLERPPLFNSCPNYFWKILNCLICSVHRQQFYSSATLSLIAPRFHLCFFTWNCAWAGRVWNNGPLRFSRRLLKHGGKHTEAWLLVGFCLKPSLQRGSVLASNCAYLK